MKKNIKVKVGSKQLAAKEFIKVWHDYESDDKKAPVQDERLYFESAEMLLKTLTPKRLELLRAVRHLKETSIRALSKDLNRDYKNVYSDVQALEQIGLLLKHKNGHLFVPWETIITEIPMNSPSDKNKGPQFHQKRRASG